MIDRREARWDATRGYGIRQGPLSWTHQKWYPCFRSACAGEHLHESITVDGTGTSISYQSGTSKAKSEPLKAKNRRERIAIFASWNQQLRSRQNPRRFSTALREKSDSNGSI